MRSSLLAKLCPVLATLAAPAAHAAPQTTSAPPTLGDSAAPSLLLPRSEVTVSGSLEARARQTLAARSPLAAKSSLEHYATYSLAGGRSLVRFRQTHDAIPVLSRGAAVLIDAGGRATGFSTLRVARRFATSSKPALSAVQVLSRANASAPGAQFSASDARLAWLPRSGAARLVWVLYQGLIPGTPRAPVVLVDAHSGHVVQRFDATSFDRAATVFEQNPVITPTPTSITLDALPQGATKLENERLRSLNCIDKQTLVGKWKLHGCELEPTALADAQGDFPYTFTSDTAAEDPFAEVSMFYHANKAYAFFESLGVPELTIKPLTTVANVRFPAGWEINDFSKMKDPSIPLEPYDNAFFTPDNPYPGLFSGIQGGLFFGQGTAADFAYDGDVVYHEFGHAVVDRTINLSHFWHLDAQGAAPTPGAMNEALADYFSSAITGDGKLGEYAAKNVSFGFGDQVIRDLDNSHSCPANVSGEVHVDSTLFSGALWSTRQALPSTDRAQFDTALVTAMLGAVDGDLGYEDLAELFAAAIEESPLGASVSTALKTELEKRGVLPRCERVLEYKGKPIDGPEWKLASSFYAAGRPYVGFDESYEYAPGLFQVHRKIDPGTEQVKVLWEEVFTGPQYDLGPEAEPFTPAVLIRFGEDPISFDYSGGLSSNAEGPLLPSPSSVTVDVPAGATDVWVMIVNMGDEIGLYRSVSVQLKSAPPAGGSGGLGGSGGFGGAFGGTGANSAAGSGGTGDLELAPAGGCSTRSGSGNGGALALGLAALGLAFARRRRAR